MLILTVGLLFIVWFVWSKRAIATFVFKNGSLSKQTGKVNSSFIIDLKEIAIRSGISGTIKVKKSGPTQKLIFSSQIPDNIQQRIRNVFPYTDSSKPNDSNRRKG